MRDLRKEELQRLLDIAKSRKREKLRVAIYARKSKDDRERLSLDAQIEECKIFVTKYDFILGLEKTFSEDDVSGMFIEQRVEFQKMMKEVEDKSIEIVLSLKADRFSRDAMNMAASIKAIDQSGAYFIALDDIGDNSAAGTLIRQIFWNISEFYVRRNAEDTFRVLANRAKQGFSAGGVANYGYSIVAKRYVINPEEAIVVNMIFDGVQNGLSYKDIIEQIDMKGFKSRCGKKFTASTIHGILHNEKVAGTMIWNAKGRRKKKKRILKENFDEVRVQNGITEAVIDKTVYDKVQTILGGRSVYHCDTVHAPYLLTGIITCNYCGKPMIGQSQLAGEQKKIRRTYTCPRHLKKNGGSCAVKDVNANYIEQTVKQAILEYVNHHVQKFGIDEEAWNQISTIEQELFNKYQRENNRNEALMGKMVIGLHTATSSAVIKATNSEIVKLERLMNATNQCLSKAKASLDAIKAVKNRIINDRKPISMEELFCHDLLSRQLIKLVVKEIKVSALDIEIDFLE